MEETMNTIEYYSISDGYDDEKLPDSLKLNYSTREKAIEAIVTNYKPYFRLDFIYDKLRLYGVYQNYNSSLYQFSEGYGDHSGYYDITIGETQHKIIDETIEFFAELFITFTEAEKIYTPEVKVPGQPYQPSKKEIKKIQEIGPMPLYRCKKYGNEYIYGVESDMDNWYKTSKATVQNNIYIYHNTLVIH